MPPKKGKKKNQDQYLDHIDQCSKWANALIGASNSESEDEKKPFIYDFTNVKEFYQKGENTPSPLYTEEEKNIIKERNQKIRIEKEAKRKIKEEKLKKRQTNAQAQKKVQQEFKQKNQRIHQKADRQFQKQKNTSFNSIPIIFLVLLLLLCLLQYQRQIYLKLSHLRLSPDKNLYEVLQSDSGATDAQIKSKYRNLLLKYHPDKGCTTCTVRFQQIVEAYEILGDPQKRRSYDQNSGYVSLIKSKSVTLSPQNFDSLLSSNAIWLIQVYDSTDEYSRHFADFWEEEMEKYSPLINFARVDSWRQSNMMSYLPYRFQFFPAVYIHFNGMDALCELHDNRIGQSLEKCIETYIPPIAIDKIDLAQNIPVSTNGKINVLMGKGIHLYGQTNIVHQKYAKYFNYYKINNWNNKVMVDEGEEFVFKNSKAISKTYEAYLQSYIVQKTNPCTILLMCQEHPCIILLQENTKIKNNKKHYPVYTIQNREFQHLLKQLLQKQQIMEKFELMIYQNGIVWLGYKDEVEGLLQEAEGEIFQLKCERETIIDWFINTFSYIKEYL